ncbi:hypothetical protein BFW86_24465 [Pseudomonas fluorescens]|nr:hypothetical protein BFW86_24465 [Pseudomonas fluorescens]
MKKLTQKELKAQIVELSIAYHRASLAVVRRRKELNDEYARYFRVHGQPEPNHHGIRFDDPRYEGVIAHTNDACDAMRKAKRERYNAKRRVDKAVRQLMLLTNQSFAVPASPAVTRRISAPVRRFSASGETLQ